jgi:gamma-butyrobetaine dioxygenase
MVSISKIQKNSSYLKIIWNDGEESKFNYMWLRDNCPTAHDKDSRHRMFNILEISQDINPKTYDINSEGKLEIEWSEGNHKSYYDLKWLRENCYTIKNKKEYVSPYQLWDNSLEKNINSIHIEHEEIISSDEGLIKWLELLHFKGISIVKNAPTEKKSAFKVLNRISHTRETFFNTPFEVINVPKPSLSYHLAINFYIA